VDPGRATEVPQLDMEPVTGPSLAPHNDATSLPLPSSGIPSTAGGSQATAAGSNASGGSGAPPLLKEDEMAQLMAYLEHSFSHLHFCMDSLEKKQGVNGLDISGVDDHGVPLSTSPDRRARTSSAEELLAARPQLPSSLANFSPLRSRPINNDNTGPSNASVPSHGLPSTIDNQQLPPYPASSQPSPRDMNGEPLHYNGESTNGGSLPTPEWNDATSSIPVVSGGVGYPAVRIGAPLSMVSPPRSQAAMRPQSPSLRRPTVPVTTTSSYPYDEQPEVHYHPSQSAPRSGRPPSSQLHELGSSHHHRRDGSSSSVPEREYRPVAAAVPHQHHNVAPPPGARVAAWSDPPQSTMTVVPSSLPIQSYGRPSSSRRRSSRSPNRNRRSGGDSGNDGALSGTSPLRRTIQRLCESPEGRAVVEQLRQHTQQQIRGQKKSRSRSRSRSRTQPTHQSRHIKHGSHDPVAAFSHHINERMKQKVNAGTTSGPTANGMNTYAGPSKTSPIMPPWPSDYNDDDNSDQPSSSRATFSSKIRNAGNDTRPSGVTSATTASQHRRQSSLSSTVPALSSSARIAGRSSTSIVQPSPRLGDYPSSDHDDRSARSISSLSRSTPRGGGNSGYGNISHHYPAERGPVGSGSDYDDGISREASEALALQAAAEANASAAARADRAAIRNTVHHFNLSISDRLQRMLQEA
jgi:hypothetical protein